MSLLSATWTRAEASARRGHDHDHRGGRALSVIVLPDDAASF